MWGLRGLLGMKLVFEFEFELVRWQEIGMLK